LTRDFRSPQRALLEHIDKFVGEWLKTLEVVSTALAAKNLGPLNGLVGLEGADSRNLVNAAGNGHLESAAEYLLLDAGLTQKTQRGTARKAIIQALFAQIPKARKTGSFSEVAIAAGAKSRLAARPTDDGLYVLPLVFAPKSKEVDFTVGPVRIVPSARFHNEYAAALDHEASGESTDVRVQLAQEWDGYVSGYDHVVAVDLRGHEEEMGWPVAREAAEILLNFVRMLFGFNETDDIRVGGGFVWERTRSRLIIKTDGEAWLSTSYGPYGTHLDDLWATVFDRELSPHRRTMASLLTWLTSGDGYRAPVLERLRYAHRLIAEAYSEPNDAIRLVRTVSALEGLALTPAHDKAHQLARRCACVGGWGDPARAVDIYDRVQNAYHWRSAVVHGDGPPDTDVKAAFLALEEHLLQIVMGFMTLYAGIQRSTPPQSPRILRRKVTAKIDGFFWYPWFD
jgi:hypothetical protein